MGWFKDKDKTASETARERKKAAAARKQAAELDQQIADLQIRKADATDDSSGDGGLPAWLSTDWDW